MAGAEIGIMAWALCPVFEDFRQLKALISVDNVGDVPIPIGAGADTPWRVLVRTPGREGFETVPRTPVPLQYDDLEVQGGAALGVPPNPPNRTNGVGDFATRHWPPSAEAASVDEYLAPEEPPYYVPPLEERGGLVERGSTLVFNLPVDQDLQLVGIALVMDGRVVGVEYFDDWPAENEDADF